jgi:hypothetical protein
MRYLILAADYTDSPLRDEFEGPVRSLAGLGLSIGLVRDLDAWNQRYRSVISLGPERRSTPAVLAEIDQLDTDGRTLARRVSAELEPSKVRYYSEGHLRLDPPAHDLQSGWD